MKISFEEIKKKTDKIKFGKFDLIVAVGKGGIIPASIIADKLNADMGVLWVKFRDDNHTPIYGKPILIKKPNFNYKNKKILIADDVSRTGATLKKAKEVLKAKKAKTFVVNGKADYSLYNCKECIKFPWS